MTVKYWIIVASKDHVMRGIPLGIAQAGHGKRSGIARMHKGDMVVYYSPKVRFEGDEALHAFTAIGEIADEEVFQGRRIPGFQTIPEKGALFKHRGSRDRSADPGPDFYQE